MGWRRFFSEMIRTRVGPLGPSTSLDLHSGEHLERSLSGMNGPTFKADAS